MVVNDLNLRCVTDAPSKADAPLVVDANAVLAGPIALELLEPVARRNAEIVQGFGGVDGDEFAEHRPLKLGGISTYGLALEQSLRVPIGKAPDHLGK